MFVAVVDLRFVFEGLAHICTSPLGRYAPAVRLSAAIEKLALATRVAAMRDTTFGYLSLGILAEAQDDMYQQVEDHAHIAFGRLIERSFLTNDQLGLIIRTILYFQIFHEFGHYVCAHRPELRESLEHNLSSYIRVQVGDLKRQIHQDQENSKVVREVLSKEDFDLILTSATVKGEYDRLIEARLTARQDKMELMCDNFSVQNTAKFLVENYNLGSADWSLVRYTIEYLMVSSWNVLFSRRIFSFACDTWNKVAAQMLSDEESNSASDRILLLIAERKDIVRVQRFRLKYALEQFDTIMSILLHGALRAGVDVRTSIDRVYPSSAMGRILHEFSASHTDLIDRSVYTLDGLARCSSRGRSMQILLSPGAIPSAAFGDIFAFYILGQAYHFV